ncbi:MAG: nucleotidyltransferase domain-containing protein [bacterium]
MINNDYNKTVSLIKEFLAGRNIIIDKFYLFGSRARKDFNSESDYDFLIVINNDLNNSERRAIIGDLYRFLMNKNSLLVMDLIIKTANRFSSESLEPGYLAYTVKKEGIEL